MDALTIRLKRARTDNEALNELIVDYMPFIRQEAAKALACGIEYDDRVSVAMLVFMNCARQYEAERGGFIAYVRACIHNRFVDEGVKETRQSQAIVHLDAFPGEAADALMDDAPARAAYDREQERESLADEIARLAQALEVYGVALSGLAEICPKQTRSRLLCCKLGEAIVKDETLRAQFTASGRVPQRALAARFHISDKTVEKHRKYIVTIAVILLGDYPGIQSFLPKGDA